MGSANATTGLVMREPTPADGKTLYRLAVESDGLAVNSPYAYVMVGRHFAGTSLIAELDGEPAGFISGHRPQNAPDVVFVWQIAVAKAGRGRGLGKRMLQALVRQSGCRDVRYLEATVTPSNEASQRMFRGFARELGVPCEESPVFPKEFFPDDDGKAEAERLFRIGPFDQAAL